MSISTKLNRRDVLKVAAFATAGIRRAFADTSSPTLLSSSAGITLAVSADGGYQVTASNPGWVFQGSIGEPLQNITVTSGADSVGAWQEIAFDHGTARTSSIRLYDAKPVVLFSTQYLQDSANSDPFPSFASYPQGLSTFSYGGLWSYTFGALSNRSPWLLYDGHANAVIFSPAANFMTAVSQFASDNSMQGAIDSRITTLPAGFTHRTLLTFGQGINAAFDTWGQTLTSLSGKTRPANDATTLLNKLSYWTDSFSAYYYHPMDPTQYVPTLLQVPPQFNQLSVPIGCMEIDSWHYPKGSPASWTSNGSGMDTFIADPTVFPQGLPTFQQTLGLPLIAHARWIDPSSTLRNTYVVSGNVSTDPLYWQAYANYMVACGTQVLEQDWLNQMATTNFNLTDPDAFLGNMASALAGVGRTIVYCMPLPTHIMQSSKYSNVVSARVSNDGLRRVRWDELLFDSCIASAVGLWPFADAFLSVNVKDVLLATLTAGPIGSGDALGSIDAASLNQAVRADGVIVKPDVPIVPTDATFVALAQSSVAPIVASTYTTHGNLTTGYVLAYERTSGAVGSISFLPESVSVSSPVYVFDYFQNTGVVLETGTPFTTTVDYSGSYFIVAPIGPSDIAFLGDASKFVACGKKRIEELSDNGVVQVTVRFAPNESEVTLHFYAPSHPIVSATAGKALRPAPEGPQRYSVKVSPGPDGTAAVQLRVEPNQPDRDKPVPRS